MNINNREYLVSDLALATTISLYAPISSINKDNPRRVIFTFEKTKELSNLLDLYRKQELQVEPQSFFNQLKIIKNWIYSTE